MGQRFLTSRQRVISLIENQKTDCLPLMPITMMWAADQLGATYREYVTDYRVLVEAQIRTAEAFDFDYVSCISDPAREAADCGATIAFFEDQPPAIVEGQARLADKTDLRHLTIPDPLGGGRMHDRVKAAALFKQNVGTDKSLSQNPCGTGFQPVGFQGFGMGSKLIEGWIEGPIAEAADLRGLNTLMLDLMDDPVFVRDLFEFVVELGLRFARDQVQAGVDLIGIGDAAASLIGPRLYEELVWPYEKKLVDGLHAMGTRVRLHICGNTRFLLERMGALGCEIVDLDSMVPLAQARERMGSNQILLGNINPVTLLRNGTPETVRGAIAECHRQAGARYIVGAGCEVPRGTPPENVLALSAYARSA